MTHPCSFQWTWKTWHPILLCSPIWCITLLQPQRDTVLSKSALLYKNRPWPRGITVIKWFWNRLRCIYLCGLAQKEHAIFQHLLSFHMASISVWNRPGAQTSPARRYVPQFLFHLDQLVLIDWEFWCILLQCQDSFWITRTESNCQNEESGEKYTVQRNNNETSV